MTYESTQPGSVSGMYVWDLRRMSKLSPEIKEVNQLGW